VDRVVDDLAVEIGRVLEALQPTIRVADEAINVLGTSRGTRGAETPPITVPNLGIQHYLWQFLCWFTDAMERLAGVTYR